MPLTYAAAKALMVSEAAAAERERRSRVVQAARDLRDTTWDFDGSWAEGEALLASLRAKARAAGGAWRDPFSCNEMLADPRDMEGHEWARARDKIEPPVVCGLGFDPSDVKQGDLGDCWFLAALALVAEPHEGNYRDPLDRLFINTEANEEGVFVVRFWRGGQWTLVPVDDRFLFSTARSPERLMKYAQPGGEFENVIWAMLLEKAYAKLRGGFKSMNGGWPRVALANLIPYGTSDVITLGEDAPANASLATREALWGKMVQARKEKSLMAIGSPRAPTAGNKKDGHDEDITIHHLIAGHAFSILRMYEEASETEEGYLLRLVNIRSE